MVAGWLVVALLLLAFGLSLGLDILTAVLARGLLLGHCFTPCNLRSLGLGGLPLTRPSHFTLLLVATAAPGEERTPLFSLDVVRSLVFVHPY